MKAIVCLDAGHAESTPGKRSPYSSNGILPALDIREYDFNRSVVIRIAQKLERLGIEPFIVTPEIHEDISLTERYKRANRKKEENPDAICLFISVHANACGDGTSWNNANGWSCYTTKGKTNSDLFAECIYEAAEKIFKAYRKKIRKDMTDGDSDYEENFTVLVGAKMPAVLTENFFFTNVEDAEFMLSENGKEAIAEAHVNGILKYLEKIKK